MKNILNQFTDFIDLSSEPQDFRESIQSLVHSSSPLPQSKLISIADLSFDDDKIVNIYDINDEIKKIDSIDSAVKFVEHITEDLTRVGGLFEIDLFFDKCPLLLRIALQECSANESSHLIWTNHIYIYEWYSRQDTYLCTSTYFFVDKIDD